MKRVSIFISVYLVCFSWHAVSFTGYHLSPNSLFPTASKTELVANTEQTSVSFHQETSVFRKKLPEITAKALSLLAEQDSTLFEDDDFVKQMLKNPYLLEDYRMFDYFMDLYEQGQIQQNEIETVAAFIKKFYPSGKKTEFINIYSNKIENETQEPNPIGIGNIDHTHPSEGDPILKLKEEKKKNFFVHGGMTAFIILTDEVGRKWLVTTCRATKKMKSDGTLKNKGDGGLLESVSGGHVQAGETLKQAATRELHEELGLNITDVPVVGYNRYADIEHDNTHDWVGLVILNKQQSSELQQSLGKNGVNLIKARDEESLIKYIPGNIKNQKGFKTPEELTQDLIKDGRLKMPGFGEIAYALTTPFDVMVDFYNKSKLQGKRDSIFAWGDDNFLEKQELVNNALEEIKSLSEDSNLPQHDMSILARKSA